MPQKALSIQEGCQDVGELMSMLGLLYHCSQDGLQQTSLKVQPAAVSRLCTTGNQVNLQEKLSSMQICELACGHRLDTNRLPSEYGNLQTLACSQQDSVG